MQAKKCIKLGVLELVHHSCSMGFEVHQNGSEFEWVTRALSTVIFWRVADVSDEFDPVKSDCVCHLQ